MQGHDIGSALSTLTCLRDLKLYGYHQPVAALSALRVDSLHRLELGPLWDKPDAEGLAVLQQATSITRLCFHAHVHEVDQGLGRVIGGLTGLRSLDVKYNKTNSMLNYPLKPQHGTSACLIREEDLAPLTAFTHLKFKGVSSEHADMAFMAASIGSPAWFGKPHHIRDVLSVVEGQGATCALTGAESVCVSQSAVRPCGAQMLPDFCTQDA